MLVLHTSTSNAGFSLIEIMIAVLILSIGMLGVAGLQVTGVRNSHTASTQTIAALETSNLISRIRNNPEYWKSGNSDLDIKVDVAGLVEETEVTCEDTGSTETQTEETETVIEPNNCIDTVASLNDVDDKDCRSEICTSPQIAKYDLQQWANRLGKKDPVTGRSLLPFQGAEISKADGIIVILLKWLEAEAKLQGRAEHYYLLRIKS